MKLEMAWSYLHIPNTRKKILNLAIITNLNASFQQFLQRWYLALLILRTIQGTQSFTLALSQKIQNSTVGP